MSTKKDVKNLAQMAELLRDAERIALIDLSAPVRRGMLIALSDLRRALEGVESAHRTEHIGLTGELPGESRT
jgi:hypothetical protein